MKSPGIEPVALWWKPTSNCLSYSKGNSSSTTTTTTTVNNKNAILYLFGP
jgi:hypothetical protein